MSNTELLARASVPFLDVVRTIKPDQLAAPTPCTGFDVRELVNHLLCWGPSLAGAGSKEAVPPAADVDFTEGDWKAALEAHVDRTLAAWATPGAWDGMTYFGGPMLLPAEIVGGMLVGEFVVHGWDLARATGQRPSWDEDVLVYLQKEVERSAAQGREMGVYGPAVPVTSSSTLDKVLGLTGRDPAWVESVT
jgi:uncharacterized protein (TIGR03086 family)